MTVLVTGAGLVGCQVAARLVEMGERPLLFDIAPLPQAIGSIVNLDKAKIVRGDILDPLQLMKAIEEEQVTRVIHTVAFFGLTRGAQANPFAAIRLNILGTAHVLEVSRLKGVERVVISSTGMVYQRPGLGRKKKPLDEDFSSRAVSGHSSSVYATTKLACEHIGLNYHEVYGLDFVAVRYASVFGPWKGPVSGRSGLLIAEAVEQALSGKPVTLDGEAWYRPQDMVYSKDAALGTALACFAQQPKSRVYNIGLGKLTKLAEIAQGVLQTLGLAALVQEKGNNRALPALPAASIERARTDLNYAPQFPLGRAVADYATWVRENYRT